MKGVNKKSGFTLIEILVVIGLIAILAAIVLIAINPARQFAQGRNAQRTSNVNAILNAIGQDIADNKGLFGGVCANAAAPIGMASTSVKTSSGGTAGELGCLAPTYIPTLPEDPTAFSGSDTGYDVSVNSIGRVMVCAPAGAESAIPGSDAICVIR